MKLHSEKNYLNYSALNLTNLTKYHIVEVKNERNQNKFNDGF